MISDIERLFDVLAIVAFVSLSVVGGYLVVTSGLNLAFSAFWGACTGFTAPYLIHSFLEKNHQAESSGVHNPSAQHRRLIDIKQSLSDMEGKINNVNTDEEIKEIEEDMNGLRLLIDDSISKYE